MKPYDEEKFNYYYFNYYFPSFIDLHMHPFQWLFAIIYQYTNNMNSLTTNSYVTSTSSMI